jgi:antitoxin component YwqK of YwqJK toxin-antitoxin module
MNGKKEGLWILWYGDNQKWSEGRYRNGKEEGLWVSWHENGQEAYKGSFRDGKREGLWTRWTVGGKESTETYQPEKISRQKISYSDFMKEELARPKAQGIEHKLAFKMAAANWKTSA